MNNPIYNCIKKEIIYLGINLTKEVKDPCAAEQGLTNEMEEDTQIVFRAHVSEYATAVRLMFRGPRSTERSINSVQSPSNSNGTFYRTRAHNSKMSVEPQEIPNSQRNLETEEPSWTRSRISSYS